MLVAFSINCRQREQRGSNWEPQHIRCRAATAISTETVGSGYLPRRSTPSDRSFFHVLSEPGPAESDGCLFSVCSLAWGRIVVIHYALTPHRNTYGVG